MNRRKSRETVMKLLFEMSINKEDYKVLLENLIEGEASDIKGLDIDYITKTLQGTVENMPYIDTIIDKYLVKWKLNRLSKINIAILRLCTCEIIFAEEIPDTVIINEGIELAKKYSEEKSAAFINGVLANISIEKANIPKNI
ncbi:MAG TPA: transcription antitermination factor NusB [Clostridiaceae bacterium]